MEGQRATYLQLSKILLEASQIQALLQSGEMCVPEFVKAALGLLQLHQKSTINATVVKMVCIYIKRK